MFKALSADEAYRIASEKGLEGKFKFKNDDGVRIYFEFVGVLDLMHLGLEAGDDEVWYEIKRMRCPMSRKRSLLPSRSQLSAFKYEKSISRSSE